MGCEAALWARRVELCSPFIAADKSEVLLVNTAEFIDIVMRHENSRTKVGRYADTFCDYIGDMCNCRWRTVICNDFSVIEDLVHRIFDYTSAMKNSEKMSRMVRRSTRHTVRDKREGRSGSSSNKVSFFQRLSRVTGKFHFDDPMASTRSSVSNAGSPMGSPSGSH